MSGLQLIRSGGRALPWAAALALSAALAACSGGAATQENPVTTPPPVADYTGPAPASADVQAFKINLWDNIKATNRCGGCHGTGGQTPQFARTDDVNLAYQEAAGIVTLAQPDQSRMVVKVAGGHNCWLQSTSACADTLTVWIRNWAGATAGGGRQIELQAPPIKEVGASKTFPTDPGLFASTVWQVLHDPDYTCIRCHRSNSATPQSPFFASDDVNEAYEAAKPKINLDNPAESRFVLRLRREFHNCWSDCESNAAEMEAAIAAFAGQIQPTQVDPALKISKALTLYDGTIAAGGNRYDTNVIALYEFKTGTGTIVYDTSGVEPALNLTRSGNTEWVGGWGLSFGPGGGKAQGSTTASKKLADMIRATGEFTFEVWAAPANVVQEDAYIVSYSGGAMTRNATLAQRAYQYEAMVRSSETDANGTPLLATDADDEDVQASLQHVVVTFDPVNGRRIYVNGEFTGDADPLGGGGTLADWDDSFALVLGNETSSNRPWEGVLRLVAIHNRALTLEQIRQNFEAGVGERYFLLFNVSHLVDVPQAYVMFEASQYDSHAYLFTRPTFISLDPDAQIGTIPIKGIRIGINGSEARVGQAYVPLDTTVTASDYTAGVGQPLASVGTVIGLEKGPASDEFFLSFERIGSHSHTPTEPDPPPPSPPADGEPQPDIGVRTFEKLHATFSEVTGVPMNDPAVAQTYETVKQGLPTVESIDAFLASHQTAIAQLAIEYCNALVENGPRRQAFFGAAFDPSGDGAYVNSPAVRDPLIDALIARAVGSGIATQPAASEVRAELESLIGKLSTGAAGSTAGRAGVVAKAACAAVLGSATTLLH